MIRQIFIADIMAIILFPTILNGSTFFLQIPSSKYEIMIDSNFTENVTPAATSSLSSYFLAVCRQRILAHL